MMLACEQTPIQPGVKEPSESLPDLTGGEGLQKFAKTVQASAVFCTRCGILVLMLVVGLAYGSVLRARADDTENERSAKIMTQNMDAGTDLGYLTRASDAKGFFQGVFFTYQEITSASMISRRAMLLANEIARAHPTLVGLQEVTLWRTGPFPPSSPPPSASTRLYDQLQLLLDDLAKLGLSYEPLAVQTLTDAEAPVIPKGVDLRITDQNVVLVRSDWNYSRLTLSNIQVRQFQDHSELPTPSGNVLVLRGWISLDAKVRGRALRFVTTHLDDDPVIQRKQANELLQALDSGDNLPVILCGDFNADADTPNATIAAIVQDGFTDAWPALHPSNPGYTQPLYLEDLPQPGPFTAASTPFKRIDLVFVRDLGVTQIHLIGNQVSLPPPNSTSSIPSDHTGMVASVSFDR